jgi:hypothetical protein
MDRLVGSRLLERLVVNRDEVHHAAGDVDIAMASEHAGFPADADQLRSAERLAGREGRGEKGRLEEVLYAMGVGVEKPRVRRQG